MGSTVFPVPSSGAGLPAGATEKVASGFVKNGYASVSGSFPAGKYLVVADTACNVNFTSAMDVNGYQNAIFSKGGSCVVDVPVSTSVIEYTAALAQDEYVSYTGQLTTAGSYQPYQNIMAANTRLAKIASDGMGLGGAYPCFAYKGKLISLTSVGRIWKSTDWENGIDTGLSTGFSPTSGGGYLVATDGTTWRGTVNSSTTAWSTTNPEAGGWSTQTLPNAASNFIYGNGVWLALGINTTTYSYSTNGGSTWSTGTLPLNAAQYAPIAFGNGKFVMAGTRSMSNTITIAYSTDGINWTTVTVGNPQQDSGNRVIEGVAFGNGRFVVGWGAWLNTTDIRSPNTFVSTDGVNWIPGSRCYFTTGSSSQHRFYPVFDGTGFNFMSDVVNAGWRTIDGINTMEVAGYNNIWAGVFGTGTRGNYVSTSGQKLTSYKPNSTFAIYKLDPSYTTY